MINHIPPEIVAPLLQWFEENARVLPWRSDPTPYHVWVSEIMLQQTRVEACIPYYTRFMAALPDIFALADADEQLLLKLWEGLGYYSRVRNLQKTAKILVRDYGGQLPQSPEALKKLPGIGPYTAGAISSISYGCKAPAVDGNVLRVLSRVTAYSGEVTASGVREKTEKALQAILPDAVGKFNQALMELGALVCIPNGSPICQNCPLCGCCQALQNGNPLSYPVKAPKKPRRKEEYAVLLLLQQGKIAIRQRGEQGLLSRMWEYPLLPGTPTGEEICTFLQTEGLQVSTLRSVGHAKHIFTHIEWQMTGYLVECSGVARCADWVWVTPAQLHAAYPIPSAFRTFTQML